MAELLRSSSLIFVLRFYALIQMAFFFFNNPKAEKLIAKPKRSFSTM